jgi:hypothetical protein
MDALLTIIGTAVVLALFAVLSVAFGADTRDGFTERLLRPTFR